MVQLLLGLLRQVANFDCFCGGNLVNWNPCVWYSETEYLSQLCLHAENSQFAPMFKTENVGKKF